MQATGLVQIQRVPFVDLNVLIKELNFTLFLHRFFSKTYQCSLGMGRYPRNGTILVKHCRRCWCWGHSIFSQADFLQWWWYNREKEGLNKASRNTYSMLVSVGYYVGPRKGDTMWWDWWTWKCKSNKQHHLSMMIYIYITFLWKICIYL